MGKEFSELDPNLTRWIGEQKLFFTATAPLAGDGLVNCSPKGMDTFRVLGPRTVAYLDLTGSGVATIAHLKENRRITVMFCAFAGAPRILRLYGKGEVCELGSARYEELLPHFQEYPGARSIILIEVERVLDSCGFSIPEFAYTGERETLAKWAEKKGPQGVEEYRAEKNRTSIDGLPGFGTR